MNQFSKENAYRDNNSKIVILNKKKRGKELNSIANHNSVY
mgnify:CR=1 FL=1|jgi:hypothetical protein